MKDKIELDELRNKQNNLESYYDKKVFPGLFWIRLDGRHFSSFTKNLNKPFSKEFSNLMRLVTKDLFNEFNPVIAHVGSDEISLGFDNNFDQFNRRIQKLDSIIASYAGSSFTKNLLFSPHDSEYNKMIDETKNNLPHFDSRIIYMPTKTNFINYLEVRVADVNRNAIRAILNANMKEFELNRISNKEGLLILSRIGKDPKDYFKTNPSEEYGTIYVKEEQLKELSDEELKDIPEKYRPKGPVPRKVIVEKSLDEAIEYIINKISILL